MTRNARRIVEEVQGRRWTTTILSGQYEPVMPLTITNFSLGAVLPAVFYMFRFGHRRGTGKFLEVFGGEGSTKAQRRQQATVQRIAERLSQTEDFEGFDDPTARAVLADLLLSYCLENKKRELGRDQPVLRVFPCHFLASWIDLPHQVAHLRFVPELLVALLAGQPGESVTAKEDSQPSEAPFPVVWNLDRNLLLRAFGQGMEYVPENPARNADRFNEDVTVGLDQLLTIRLAQQLQEPPQAPRGRGNKAEISNQRPIAQKATEQFAEDLRLFLQGFSSGVPRQVLADLLEAAMAVGLTAIFTSTVSILLAWDRQGIIPPPEEQAPVPLLVDCPQGLDRQLRAVAEESLEEFWRLAERMPYVLMVMRLLDQYARADRQLRHVDYNTRPYATEWLNLLGELLHQRHELAQFVRRDFDRICFDLADALEEEYPQESSLLAGDQVEENPIRRLADVLVCLRFRGLIGDLNEFIDSFLATDGPHGLAVRRKVTRKDPLGRSRQYTLRRLVFTDTVLEYLVHLFLAHCGNQDAGPPSLRGFLQFLRLRFGFCVDEAPQGLSVPGELLLRNRMVLERRLRDLGLLVGVNDAESMKRLQPRFPLENQQ